MRLLQIEEHRSRPEARGTGRTPMNTSTQILLLILIATVLAILAFAVATTVLV